jgi:hypothetical protein
VRDEYKAKGITIEYTGYDSALKYDPAIQNSMNNTFIATMKAQELAALAPVLPVLQSQTHMQAELGLVSKWGSQLPNPSGFVFVPSGLFDRVISWFNTDKTSVVAKQ